MAWNELNMNSGVFKMNEEMNQGTDVRGFSRNVLIISFGTVLSAAISFLLEPFIARFFPPAIFGSFSIINAVLLILPSLLCLRYNFAIVQANDFRERANLLTISFFLIIFFQILIIFVSLAIPNFFSSVLNFEPGSLVYFNICIFSLSLGILIRFWFAAEKKFWHLSVSNILLQAGNTLLLLAFGFLSLRGYKDMLMARTIACIMYPSLMVYYFFSREFRQVLSSVDYQSMIKTAKKYIRFPIYDTFGFAIYLLSGNIIVFFIGMYFSIEQTGLFAKAYYLLYLMVLVVGDSVSRVLHKEVVDILSRHENPGPFISRMLYAITIPSFMLFAVLAMIGPELFSVFFGKVWSTSGILASMLAPVFFFNMISMILRPLFGLYNKQNVFTLFVAFSLIFSLIAFYWLQAVAAPFLVVIGGFFTITLIFHIFQINYLFRKMKIAIGDFIKGLLTLFLLSLIPALLVVMGKVIFHWDSIVIIILCVLGNLPYLFYVIWEARKSRILIHLFKK